MAKTTPSPLGKRLRSLRKEKGWTLDWVAKRSGISKSTLSKLENGQTNLTFSSVSKLSQGLDLPITALTSPPEQQITARRSLTRLGGGARFAAKDASYEVLCNDLSDKNNAFMRVTINSHQLDEKQPWRRHPGQEFLYVLEGTLVLYTEAYEPATLKAGDSIVFDSSMGHKYVSKGKKDAELLIAMQVIDYPDIEKALEELP